MAKPENMPETFNGTPTEYRVLDGFRRSSRIGQCAWAVGLALAIPTVGVSLVIPAFMEISASNKSNEARKDAKSAMEHAPQHPQQLRDSGAYAPSMQPGIGQAPEINPEARQGHAAALNQPTMASASPSR